MELLRWGKEQGLINYGCLEFVASHKWDELKYLRDNGISSRIATEILTDD
jgi:hypothetical protein